MRYNRHMWKDVLLAAGSALRLTRFVVLDDLGRWLVREPAYRWANAAEHPVTWLQVGRSDPALADTPDPANGWRSKTVGGLECPFCIGFWISSAVVISRALAGHEGRGAKAWRILASALTLSEVVGHVAIRIGDAGWDEGPDDSDRGDS